MTARAATDWLFEACHPAPAREFSTWTAKNPKTRSTSAQPMSTRRKWVAAQGTESGERAGAGPVT